MFILVLVVKKYTIQEYLFHFNGKEKDDETYGNGNAIDFGARIFDPRIGRWMSIDPLVSKYPDLTPYHFTGNSPIVFLDRDGNDFGVKAESDGTKNTIIITSNVYTTNEKAYKQALAASGDLQKVKKTAVIDGVSFEVSFQVNVSLASENVAKANVYNKDPEGNLYKGETKSKDVVLGEDVKGGETEFGRVTSMVSLTYSGLGGVPTTSDMGNYEELLSHEFLHQMGLNDTKDGGPKGGRMEYVANKDNGFKMNSVSNSDISAIINYAIKNDGKIDKTQDPNKGAQVSISGNAKDCLKSAKTIDIK